MTGSLTRRAVRGGLLATLTVAAFAFGGGSTFAAHQVGSTGNPGSYSWTDTASHPAGNCNYNGGGTAGHTYITHVGVNAPSSALWPAGTGHSSGTVGFKVKLQHLSGGVWTTVATSSEATATASRTSSAAFPRRSVAWAGPNTGKDRGVAWLTWYSPSHTVIGRVHVAIDHYSNGFDGVERGYCPVVFTNM